MKRLNYSTSKESDGGFGYNYYISVLLDNEPKTNYTFQLSWDMYSTLVRRLGKEETSTELKAVLENIYNDDSLKEEIEELVNIFPELFKSCILNTK